MIKKILTSLTMLTMVGLLLTGCGTKASESADEGNDTAATDTTQSDSSTEDEPGSSENPVKFLVYACITGNNSESGRQVTMAADTAEWYINEKLGGFQSLDGRPIELVVVDSTSDAATATLPFERELSSGQYSVVIGNSTSSIALTMLPIAEKYQIPMITGAAANKAVSEQGATFVFQPASTSSSFIPTQLDFLEEYARILGKDVTDLNIGLVYANDAWGTDNANNTREQVEARGLNLVIEESYEVNAFTDAAPLVTKLKNANVDVLLPSSYPNDLKLLFTSMKSLQFNPLVVGGGAAMTWPSLYKDLGEDVNGITSVDSWVWNQKGATENAGWMEMNAHYEEANGEFIPGQAGPTIYSIMLAYEAIEKIGSTDSVAIRDELRNLNSDNSEWFNVLNGYGDFDDKTGLNTDSRAVIMQWQDGKPISVFPDEFAIGTLLDPETMQPFNE